MGPLQIRFHALQSEQPGEPRSNLPDRGGIVHSDIILLAGAGRMIHDAVQGITFDAGSAIDLFVTHVVTIRIEVRDVMAIEEIAAQTRYTNNLVATAGLSWWIPVGL